MKKKRSLFGLVLTFCSLTFALPAQTLSDKSEIFLLTIAPGDELWSFAGHTAIRVKDTSQGIDVNFNYGVFDFRKENFYFKFLRGTLPYEIGAYNFRDETPFWIAEGRLVTQQLLNLNTTQKQKLFDLLLENYQPENREYAYKFFYDNCSTRVRDIFIKTAGDSLRFSQTLHADSTFRDWIKLYSQKSKNYWAEFGMDLLIGVPSDEVTDANRAMYIPDNLMIALDSAKVFHNGEWQPFVLNKTNLNTPNRQLSQIPISPFLTFLLLFVVLAVISFIEYKNYEWFLFLDKILFSITGLCGIIFILLWFFTDHGVTAWNLNTFWALPVLFPTALFLKKSKPQPTLSNLFLLQAILALIVLIGFKFLPQTFHIAVLPIAATVALRSFLIWKRKA